MSGFNNATYAKYGAEVKTAEQWREFIRAGRSKTIRPCANNTSARITDENLIAIKLHDTDIVTLFSDGRAMLNSGGWQTVTTKERINRYTRASISQRGGIWYISDRKGNDTLFYDGMVIDADGYPLKPRATAQYEARLKKIKKQARQYARDFVAALKAGNVPMPSAGDCWACCMRGPKGQETFPGSGHIQEHIKEKYYVPSLLVNAMRAAGYRDEQMGLVLVGGHRLFIDPEQQIYKYVVKQLQGEL